MCKLWITRKRHLAVVFIVCFSSSMFSAPSAESISYTFQINYWNESLKHESCVSDVCLCAAHTPTHTRTRSHTSSQSSRGNAQKHRHSQTDRHFMCMHVHFSLWDYPWPYLDVNFAHSCFLMHMVLWVMCCKHGCTRTHTHTHTHTPTHAIILNDMHWPHAHTYVIADMSTDMCTYANTHSTHSHTHHTHCSHKTHTHKSCLIHKFTPHTGYTTDHK